MNPSTVLFEKLPLSTRAIVLPGFPSLWRQMKVTAPLLEELSPKDELRPLLVESELRRVTKSRSLENSPLPVWREGRSVKEVLSDGEYTVSLLKRCPLVLLRLRLYEPEYWVMSSLR